MMPTDLPSLMAGTGFDASGIAQALYAQSQWTSGYQWHPLGTATTVNYVPVTYQLGTSSSLTLWTPPSQTSALHTWSGTTTNAPVWTQLLPSLRASAGNWVATDV